MSTSTTSTTTTTKLLMNETKALDTFGIISPLVETSSSTATIESTTAQISSKSSSPFNSLTFKDSKLSPSPEAVVAASPNLGSGSGGYPSNTVKSPVSPANAAGTLPDNPILPFLTEAFCKQQQQQQNEENTPPIQNMLASTPNSNQQSTTTGSTGSISTASVPSPTNSIKNVKCEPFGTLSPINENTNSQNLSEDNSSNNNNGGNTTPSNNNITMEAALRERDGASSSSMLRQNSNSSINSCSATVNASSPNNGSDHSNSSNNSSSNISQSIENNGDLMQDLNADSKATNNNNNNTKKKINISNVLIKEEENSRTSDKCSSSGGSAKNSSCSTPTLGTLTAIKEEQDVINTLVNVKNEENTVSPDMSPVGFGSIGNVASSLSEVRAGTPVKMNELPNVTPGSNISNNNNNTSEKISAILGTSTGCAEDSSSSIGNSASNEASMGGGNTGPGSGAATGGSGCDVNSQQHSSANPFNNNSNNTVVSLGNYMDYLQQQNHIFVFSTQLANKGAESVLSGQFPTIIAYHCTQPATKNFLEDFFIKNPMKMTKLQRQSSLNICGMPVTGAGGQQWMGGCNPMNPNPKMTQKPNSGKINLGPLKSSDALPSESDLMCWEQSRNNLEGPATDAHAMKMLDSVELVMSGAGNPHGAGKMMGSVDIGGDNSVPSLQGVKVPDENLTPQQRQHREEQLAKLKKMNQFLFPENGNDFRTEAGAALQGNNQLNKLPTDGVAGNMAGIMMNMPGAGPQIGPNTLNCAIRNIPSNVMNQNKLAVCNPDNMPNAMDEALVPSDILGTHDMGGLPCNKGPCGPNIPINSQQNLTCGAGGMPGNMNVNNIPNNAMGCHGAGILGPSGLMPNSPEIVGGFNQGCGGVSDGNLNNTSAKSIGPGGVMHSQDMNQVGMAQIEWSKLQHQFFEEKIKNKSGVDMACMPNTLCRSNSAGMSVNLRQIPSSGPCTSIAPTSTNQTVKSAQGPPPPYHPTQRSASVPIATQSPNPASPNNPTSNLSLPSPRTSGALGIPANSPNMDVGHSSSMQTSTTTTNATTTTTATTIGTSNSGGNNQAKNNNFHPETGSPTSGVGGGGNNGNRNRNNFNQFNSNPSTPLSHLSPKELETFNPTAGDLKNTRPSPQRSRTPLINHGSNNIVETANMEVRYPPASPGMNFPPHIQNPAAGNVNPYKAPGPIERQNSVPVPSQFCRRTDNLPLNPNSNRPPHNKMNHSFDPISSLAQMSQQLTSCVSLNSNVGNSPGGMGVLSGNEMNLSNQSMEGMMPSMDGGMEHCGSGGNMGLSPHMGGASPFMSNNCHINSMLGPMNQRLLNPKVCGGFNSAGGGGMRDGPGSFHGGAMPSHRMMGRMAVNFGNFNVSPNIQVKASTPNTIQYMPVRPQNNNNNMRVPPSLEFLQRYTNHQMPSGNNVMDNGHMGQVNSGPPGDLGKMNNPNNIVAGNSPINFFPNCNQMGPMGGPDQDDMNPNMMQAHEMNMGSSMMRGMRPMRHNMGHGSANPVVAGPRMQAPGPNLVGPNVPQFPGAPQDSMECNDSADMFGPSPNVGPQMYNAGQQKSLKPMGGMCQNMPGPGTGAGNNGQLPNQSLLPNEHNAGMPTPVNGPVMLGNNSNILPNAMSVGGNNTSPVACAGNGPGPGATGNPNYKTFVGPSSNDLKYAQQYHSFQQQLYATSTRSQQVGGNNAISTNPTGNAAFFVNK